MQSMPKTNKEIQDEIKSLIGRLGTLQTESVIRYEMRRNPDKTREDIEYLLNGLRLGGVVFVSEYNVMPDPARSIEGDMAIAFWAYTMFAEKAGDRFLAANWPSSIMFRTDEKASPYRITVCHSAEKDENLAVLQNKRWDGVFNEIIVGVNLTADEVDREQLPKGDSLIFISYQAKMPLIDFPHLEMSVLEAGDA